MDVTLFQAFLSLLSWAVYLLFCVGAICIPLYLDVSRPLRRQESAAVLLDLVEGGLKDGRTPEQTVTALANGVCRSMGMRFLLLATCIQDGQRLSGALREVGGVAPRSVVAMLEVGEETGEMRKVIPVCRTMLRDGASRVQGTTQFLPLLLLYLLPVQAMVLAFLCVFVLPRFAAIMADFGFETPVMTALVFEWMPVVAWIAAGITCVVMLVVTFHVFGGIWRRWEWCRPLGDWIAYQLPWRRKRFHRDFCAVLGLMLDVGLPEERAVELAARGTANREVMKRAGRVGLELREGVRLEEALRRLDGAEEFHWRLSNATHGARSIWAALA